MIKNNNLRGIFFVLVCLGFLIGSLRAEGIKEERARLLGFGVEARKDLFRPHFGLGYNFTGLKSFDAEKSFSMFRYQPFGNIRIPGSGGHRFTVSFNIHDIHQKASGGQQIFGLLRMLPGTVKQDTRFTGIGIGVENRLVSGRVSFPYFLQYYPSLSRKETIRFTDGTGKSRSVGKTNGANFRGGIAYRASSRVVIQGLFEYVRYSTKSPTNGSYDKFSYRGVLGGILLLLDRER